ncbi:iron ABC transporter permease [Treponema sp. HNW]|uniref:ABC transporter permease n=1 Tax=Treponema sp. HNW TaxID=3116654 RepID=UPI003D0F2081
MPANCKVNEEKKLQFAEFRTLLRQPLLAVSIIAVLLLLIVFVCYPMLRIIKLACTNDLNEITFVNIINIFKSRTYLKTCINSIKLAVTVSILSTIIGYIFAFAINRTEVPGRAFFNTIIQLPIISPPFILALAIIFLFGRQGIITNGLLGIKGNNVYGFKSLVFIQVISFFPVAYLTLTGILASIDTSVEDAAMNIGASRWYVFWTVTFPLSMPGVISAVLLTFVQSLEDFSNPAVIGGNYTTLSTEAYRTITGMYDFHSGAALAVVLLAPTITAFLLQRYWLKKKSFVTITGKTTSQTRKIHGKNTIPFFIFCTFISAVFLLLYGTVFVGAFAKTWGIDYTLGITHFIYAWKYAKEALQKSLLLSLIAAPLTGLLGIYIAYLTIRKQFPGKRFMQISSLLTFAIPGTVLGIGYVSAFNTGFIVLTGTPYILLAAFMFRNISVAIESGVSTLLQIDKSIGEASTILGASNATTFRRITLPLLKSPFFTGIVFSFVRSMTAVSTVIFLTSPKWPLATSKVYGLFDISKYSDAAALVVYMIVIILLAIGIIKFLVSWILKPRVHKL